MRTSRLILSSLSILACRGTETVSGTTDHEFNNFNGFVLALKDLGYNSVPPFPALELLIPNSPAKNSSDECVVTCKFLGTIMPNATSQPGSASYVEEESSYWSNLQAETLPACRVEPVTAKDVSASLLVTKFFGCPFAVKSGGHAAFKGASNIDRGLTIDLTNLNIIQVSSDNTLTQVGAGNRWIDVYTHLDPLQLSVIGGRVADIGVGGLTLGGGISFFSGRHGWACDGVRNYQVVLANASIIEVNQQSFPDLYFALRGGGNNFGIVTRFDLETFPQGQMWGGMTYYSITANASLLDALRNLTANAPTDPDAALIVAFAYAEGEYVAATDIEYAKPIVDPPIFQDFMDIESIASTLRITTLSNLTEELKTANPSGFREFYSTATFKNTPNLQNQILEIFVTEVNGIKDADGILPALVLQPVTTDVISYFSKNGGNALGIAESDGPLILMNLAIMWSSPLDDDRIIAAGNRVVDSSVALAKTMNADYRYIYQNYASPNQDVFDSYGAANKQRLIEISRKYDPEQIFQTLQPGYFKLD